jgi:hypothetical protein
MRDGSDGGGCEEILLFELTIKLLDSRDDDENRVQLNEELKVFKVRINLE